MADQATETGKHWLEPMERLSEALFGIIMVLGFTGSLSVATADRPHVRTMMLGALGCNLAWGLIDAVFYLMACASERGHNILAVRRVRTTNDIKEAHRIIANALPPLLTSTLPSGTLEHIRQKLMEMPEPPTRARPSKDEWIAALGVFLWVFLSTFPVVIPFLIFRHARAALRISNAVAIVMLFIVGYAFGRYSGYRPIRVGVVMVLLGAGMVGLTIVLGG